MEDKHIIVIGGGPAGTEAAITAARHVTRTTLVSEGPFGDWSKLLPSRVWLNIQQQIRAGSRPPLSDGEDTPIPFDFERTCASVQRATTNWQRSAQETFDSLGVEQVQGRARFVSESEIAISNADATISLTGDAFIVTVGSEPIFPPGLEPDGQLVYSAATIEQMSSWPENIIVLGDGPIGYEFVEMFSFSGVAVTWVVLEGGPGSTWGAEADEVLLRTFRARGVKFRPGPPLKTFDRSKNLVSAISQEGETVATAQAAFVTVGAKPTSSTIGLDTAGVEFDERGSISASEFGQTSIPTIYVAGDARQPTAAGLGMAQARTAAAHAAGVSVEPFNPKHTAYSFGLNPQVAKVGTTNESADTNALVVPYTDCLVAHVSFDDEGFLKLFWDGNGIILGGLAVGRLASEIITPIEMAVRLGLTLEQLATCQAAHPALSELPFIAARKALSRRT